MDFMVEHKLKVLILLAHPNLIQSQNNRELLQASKSIDNVTIVDLYAQYPNYRINIDQEQTRLLEHDVIIFMFPFYWYSTPSILKEWQDLVLEVGFAYGAGGKALQEKYFLCCITAGASEEFYLMDTDRHYSLRSFLTPLEQMSRVTRMQFIPPYILFDSRTAQEDDRLEPWLMNWKKILEMFTEGTFRYDDVKKLPVLNEYFITS